MRWASLGWGSVAVLVAAAAPCGCKTEPVASDAGLSAPPASASASAAASGSTAPLASAAPGASSESTGTGSECKVDADCGPASCCGPFMAEGKCVRAAARNCSGVLCPQIVSDWTCACRAGRCATVRVGSAAPR
jgi:hypothetical protein